MKYKVLKGTETFKKLSDLKKEIDRVSKDAYAVVKKLGATEYCEKSHRLAGGISAIGFEKKPEGYKNVDNEWRNLYYPKASNKDICKMIESLPTLPYEALNDIIGFKGPQTTSESRGIGWVNTVGIKFGKNFMLIDVYNGCKFKPNKDTKEILESEYIKLKGKK